jgi:hypothetical protein
MFEFGVRREGHLRISAVLKSRLLPLRETLLSSCAFEKGASEFLWFGVSKLINTQQRVRGLYLVYLGQSVAIPHFTQLLVKGCGPGCGVCVRLQAHAGD